MYNLFSYLQFNGLVLFGYLFPIHAIVKWRRWRAASTLSEAMGFRPRKVVRLFRSAGDIESNNLAMHSSANELLTTFTPVKSSTTRSFCSIIGNKSSRTRLPNGRVPKFSPYSLKLNVTIVRLVLVYLGAKLHFFFEMRKRSAIFFAFFDSVEYRRALDGWRVISRGSALCVTVIIRWSYGDHSVRSRWIHDEITMRSRWGLDGDRWQIGGRWEADEG